MRIAIDASRTTTDRVTGTEHYSLRLIQHVITQTLAVGGPQHDLRLYFRTPPAPDRFPATVEQRVIPFPRLWTHVRFAAELWRDRPDVVWVTAHTLPFIFPGRAVVTVHDLGYRHFPDAHPVQQRRYLDLTTRFSAARARVVLADSAATKADLTHFYGTPPDAIRVVYPGVDAPPIGDQAAVRRKYHLPERYFLFLGTLQPRKNIARITAAYAAFRQRHPGTDIALVLAGGRGWLFDEAWTRGGEGVILPGYIDDADKGALYAGAHAFIFPSLYEGFGFPVIEAMHCGTPVLTSTTSSLPEVAGEAALLIDPADSAAIADGMTTLADDDDRRAALIAAGRAHARQFTWAAAASAVLEVFAELSREGMR